MLWRIFATLCGLLCATAHAQMPTVSGVSYGTINGQPLRLNLYLPASPQNQRPLVIWIHGGGWQTGSYSPLAGYAAPLVNRGIAVAAVQYRLTGQSATFGAGNVTWPAQIHDIKGAVRFLRSRSAQYGIDPARFAVWGQSAGAHLALTLALTSDSAALEGVVGGNSEQSSAVMAVVSYYAPTDLFELGQDFALTPPNLPQAVSVVDGSGQPHAILVGFGASSEGFGVLRANRSNPVDPWPARVALALSAGPVNHASANDPAVFLAHGTADTVVPLHQVRRMRDALVLAGLSPTIREVQGFGHSALDAGTDQAARDWLVARLVDSVFSSGFE